MAKLRLVRPTRQVVEEAYHGTDLRIAKKIEKGEKFRWEPRKAGEPDLFLGDGTYFFEGSKAWAEAWAKPRYQKYGILSATVCLGMCLDLNTKEGLQIVGLVQELMSVAQKVPKKTINLAAAISYYVANIDQPLDTIRATHVKTHREPVFEGKLPLYICELIICVRNIDRISNPELIEEGLGNA